MPLRSARPILVTGAAGFIGAALAQKYLDRGFAVVGVDNINDYYDPALKLARLSRLEAHPAFRFHQLDIADHSPLAAIFAAERFEIVVHLAAQAGVRYSLENPRAYTHSNIDGFLNVLECCRAYPVCHLVFASSSSVYGGTKTMPFSVHGRVDHPLSLYAATKKANELMAHTYSHLFGIPSTGLRFFTVYGPWGRPDMALMLFATAMLEHRPINVFNNGNMRRDFTYIDDIVEGVFRLSALPPAPDPAWDPANPDPATSMAPFRIFNIGNSSPVELKRVIALLEKNLGVAAIQRMLPMQPGDVLATFADIHDLETVIDFRPRTTIEEGIAQFAEWFRVYRRN